MQATNNAGRNSLFREDDQFVRMRQAKNAPDLLVKHIGIDVIGMQERNFPPQTPALSPHRLKLNFGLLHVAFEFRIGEQATVALDAVITEIDHRKHAQCRCDQPARAAA